MYRIKTLIIARNIVNQEYIEELFKELYEKSKFKEINSWINKQLRSYIQNEIDTVKPFTKLEKKQPDWLQTSIKNKDAFEVFFKQKFKNDVKHIIDYFNSLDEKDLSKIPKLKYDVALDKSRKWTQELNKETGEWDDFKGIEIVRKYKKGMKWVRVFSKQACEREGKVMNHCVGGYYKDVRDGLTSIYSLRDNSNKPHCTIEVKNEGIEQIKGWDDGYIEPKYSKYVLNFITDPIFKKEFKFFKELSNAWLSRNKKTGDITIFENDYYTNLKVIDGSLTSKELLKPFKQKYLHIKGRLDLSDYKFNYLPETLIVDNTFIFENSKIVELPKNLTVKGTLNLKNTNVLSLPDNLKVERLLINNCKLRSLPDNLTLDDLIIEDNVRLTYLPKNLTVNNIFDIKNNKTITELPKEIKLKGKVVLNKFIKELPLKEIFGNLIVPDIVKLPENLIVHGNFIYDKLTEEEAPVPNTMTVYGIYFVEPTQKELPKNLTVDRLEFKGSSTKIKILPKNLKVKELILTSPVKFPENFRVNEIDLVDSNEEVYLPDSLKVDSIIVHERDLKWYAEKYEKFQDKLYFADSEGMDVHSWKEYVENEKSMEELDREYKKYLEE